MAIPAERLLLALTSEVAKLKALFADSNVDGSAVMSIENGLQVLLNRVRGGRTELLRRISSFELALAGISGHCQGRRPDSSNNSQPCCRLCPN